MTQWTRVLVTGARGFIGRRLVRALQELDVEVTCMDRTPARADALSDLDVRRVYGDVRDAGTAAAAVRDAEAIVHLAAATAPRSESEAHQINVVGTRTVADAAAACTTPPVLVYVSSLAVAGPNPIAVTESMACRPVSIYGRTKLAAEQELAGLAARLPVTIVRPPCVFGPGDRNLLGLFQSVRRGWNLYSDPDYQYSFLYVDDLVATLMAAVDRGRRLVGVADPARTGIYYTADPHPVTFPELASLVATCVGRKRVRQIRVPRAIGWTAATAGECLQWATRRRLFFNRDKAREAYGGSWVCDPQRAREQLDVVTRVPLVERLMETTTFYRSAGWLEVKRD